jgi:hypothetical protein
MFQGFATFYGKSVTENITELLRSSGLEQEVGNCPVKIISHNLFKNQTNEHTRSHHKAQAQHREGIQDAGS